MMASERASLFEDETDLDVSGFAPKLPSAPVIQPEQVRAISEAVQFRSRDPKPAAMPMPIAMSEAAAPARREPRRHRTGRNVQLNIKARATAIETFYALADAQGWVLGEAFERAVAALARELQK
jgi:hypothetical protein